MGITSELNPDPAIALGGLKYGVSPLEMASAYATLANGGQHIEPTIILRVTDANGNVIWEAHPKQTQAISAGVAYEVTRILTQNIESGTGTRADIGRPAAGKTGTATNWYDAWFCGYTPNLSTAVWMGDPDAQVPMNNVHGSEVTGGSFPAIMWQKFMYEADRLLSRGGLRQAGGPGDLRSLLPEHVCGRPHLHHHEHDHHDDSAHHEPADHRAAADQPADQPSDHPPTVPPTDPPPTDPPTTAAP